MVGLDVFEMKEYIGNSGMKQKAIADKAGLSETKLCMILCGKRKMEASEYANICKVLDVPMGRFLKPRLENETKNC